LADAGHKLACLSETLSLTRIRRGSISSMQMDRQHQLTRFSVACQRCRRNGVPEPTLDEFLREHTISAREWRALRFRQKLRGAMAAALAGWWMEGAALILLTAVAHPRLFLSKVASRL
jgi:hypothetical protein